MNLSIIIVSWNVKELLRKCLESILRYHKDINFEVIVVDNASNDGTVEFLKKLQVTQHQNKFGTGQASYELQMIFNKENLGFAKANNQGIERVRGEFILLLNPDTEAREGTLEKMVQFMREHPDCGVAGCKILNPDGTLQPSVRRFPTFWAQFFYSLNLMGAWPVKKWLMTDFDYLQPAEVDQVMGAFFMIRRKVIEQIGPLDEKFFIWFEEVDFCHRAKAAGPAVGGVNWKVIYTPTAEIIHHGGASFSQALTYDKQKIFSQSLLYYFKKHRQWGPYFLSLLFHPLRLVLGLGISFFQKNKRRF